MFYISSRSAAVLPCKYICVDSSSLADRYKKFVEYILLDSIFLNLFLFLYSIVQSPQEMNYNYSRTRHWFSSFVVVDCDNIFRI